MCGRYYIDENTAKGIEYIIKKVEAELARESRASVSLEAMDVFPSQTAPIINAEKEDICCSAKKWGFPGIQGKGVIFNARSESAMDKKMFCSCVESRRIIVPATRFYEWDKKKNKYKFYRKDKSVLYMAGIYNRYQEEDRFVILTTGANDSMKPVHDRMPLILEENEIEPWLFDRESVKYLLHKIPVQLEKELEQKEENRQFSLFDNE